MEIIIINAALNQDQPHRLHSQQIPPHPRQARAIPRLPPPQIQRSTLSILRILQKMALDWIHRYKITNIGGIIVVLPFAFAYFMEMQKELLKIQNGCI